MFFFFYTVWRVLQSVSKVSGREVVARYDLRVVILPLFDNKLETWARILRLTAAAEERFLMAVRLYLSVYNV